jgi:hypothetical protein
MYAGLVLSLNDGNSMAAKGMACRWSIGQY